MTTIQIWQNTFINLRRKSVLTNENIGRWRRHFEIRSQTKMKLPVTALVLKTYENDSFILCPCFRESFSPFRSYTVESA